MASETQDYLALLENLAYTGAMDDLTPDQMAAVRAIGILGGPVKAARILNVKGHRHQTVQSWLKNRVPADHCPSIERETVAAGDPVHCEELRPDITWHRIPDKNWPWHPKGRPLVDVTRSAEAA